LVVEGFSPQGLSQITEGDILCLSPRIGKSIRIAQDALDNLKKALIVSKPKPVQEKEDCAAPRARRQSSERNMVGIHGFLWILVKERGYGIFI